jgi:PAS domain S-box-containing protein
MERYLVTLALFGIATLAMLVQRIRRDTGGRIDTWYFHLAAHAAAARVLVLALGVLAGVEISHPLLAFTSAATGLLSVHCLVLFAYSFPLNQPAPARLLWPLNLATVTFILASQHRAFVRAEGPFVLMLGLMPSYFVLALFFLHRNWRASIAPGERRPSTPVTLVQASLVGPWAFSIALFITFHSFFRGSSPTWVFLAQAVGMALVVVGGTGVAVLRYHLFEIRVLMTEVVIGVGAVGVLTAYVGLGALPLHNWLQQRGGPSLAAVVVAGLPLLLIDVIRAGVPKVFHRLGGAVTAEAPARTVVEKTLAVTARMVDPDAVLAMATGALTEATGCEVRFLRAGPLPPGDRADAPDELTALSKQHPRAFYSPEHAPELPPGIVAEMDRLGAQLVVPVQRNDALYGFFVVSNAHQCRRAETLVCAAVADHLALKFENYALYAEAAQASRDLADTRAFLEDLVESLPVGVAVVDSDLRVKAWNRSLASQSGISREAALGARYFDDLYPGLRDVEGSAVMEELQRNPDKVVSRPASRFDTPEGERYRDLSVAPFKNRLGQPRGVVVITGDATERVRLSRELEESRRLAALGAFAAAVAHDIRTPLTSIQMNVQILRSRAEIPESDREYLDITLTEIDRLNRSVAEILDYARPVSLATMPVDVRELAADVVRTLQPVCAERGVSVSLAPGGDGATAPMDERLVRKVLVNLIDNAVDASPRGAVVAVSAGVTDAVASFSVRDRGRGIETPQLERIFEPFFTTRPDGTGLGLAIARKIARAHGGEVRVESAAGEGSTFSLVLPCATATS